MEVDICALVFVLLFINEIFDSLNLLILYSFDKFLVSLHLLFPPVLPRFVLAVFVVRQLRLRPLIPRYGIISFALGGTFFAEGVLFVHIL